MTRCNLTLLDELCEGLDGFFVGVFEPTRALSRRSGFLKLARCLMVVGTSAEVFWVYPIDPSSRDDCVGYGGRLSCLHRQKSLVYITGVFLEESSEEVEIHRTEIVRIKPSYETKHSPSVTSLSSSCCWCMTQSNRTYHNSRTS